MLLISWLILVKSEIKFIWRHLHFWWIKARKKLWIKVRDWVVKSDTILSYIRSRGRSRGTVVRKGNFCAEIIFRSSKHKIGSLTLYFTLYCTSVLLENTTESLFKKYIKSWNAGKNSEEWRNLLGHLLAVAVREMAIPLQNLCYFC